MAQRISFYGKSKTQAHRIYKEDVYEVYDMILRLNSFLVYANAEDCLTLQAYVLVSSPIVFWISNPFKFSYKRQQEFKPSNLIGINCFRVTFDNNADQDQIDDFLFYCKAHGIQVI